MPTDLVAVFFGLEEGEDVQSGPNFLAGEFTALVSIHLFNCRRSRIFGGMVGNVLLLTNTVKQLVVTVGHDHVHTDQVVHGPEAAGRHVALHQRDKSSQ